MRNSPSSFQRKFTLVSHSETFEERRFSIPGYSDAFTLLSLVDTGVMSSCGAVGLVAAAVLRHRILSSLKEQNVSSLPRERQIR